jgi:hypothetical protein
VELKVMVIPVLAKQLQSVLQDNRSGNDAGFRKIRTIIETTTNETPEDFWAKIHPYLKHDMFALCALDIAYNDLYAQKRKEIV